MGEEGMELGGDGGMRMIEQGWSKDGARLGWRWGLMELG